MKKRKHKKHKIHISLMELLTFGIFLLALLTFVFTFCKQPYIAKATLVLWRVVGWHCYLLNWSTPCGRLLFLCVYTIAYLRFDCKSLFCLSYVWYYSHNHTFFSVYPYQLYNGKCQTYEHQKRLLQSNLRYAIV